MSYIGSKEFYVEVAKGNVAKHTIVNKFGSNSSVGTSLEPITDGGVYQTPTALTSLEIVSDSTNDVNTTGSGAHQVVVVGLSTGWTEVTETINLNGTSAVPLSNQYFRVYRIRVVASGTYATTSAPSHNSTITLRGAGGGATWGTVIPEGGFGLGSSEIGVFSVPAGTTAYLIDTHVDAKATKPVDIILFVRESADTVAAPFSAMRAISIQRDIESNHQLNPYAPFASVVGPADIGFMASVTTGSAKVEVTFQLLCVED